MHRPATAALFWLCALRPAAAVPPLVPAADVAQPGLQSWWRDGELLVGVPTAAGRPGLRPLVGLAPVVLPADLSAWTPLGEACTQPPTGSAQVDGRVMVADIAGTIESPTVELRVDDRLIATNALGRPVRPCTVDIVQADELPGLEVVVTWRLGRDGPDDEPPKAVPVAAEATPIAADVEAAAGASGPATRAIPSGAPPTEETELRGVVVFHIPDTAR